MSDRLSDLERMWRERTDLARNSIPLKSGGHGGNDGGMDARIAKLEADMEHVKRDVGELRADMRDVRDRAIKIEATMATKAFVFSAYGIVSALLAAVMLFQNQLQQILGLATGNP